jgi:DNA/RNA-binding domain of Phe-tRNA-synthetase-like protein
MQFQHAPQIWADFPELAAGVAVVSRITADAAAAPTVADRVKHLYALADEKLADRTEAELPEIRAWRLAFSRMGLKPTQYRCAAEALLRRYRKDGRLPAIHPLVDVCNGISLAYAIPVAVLDLSQIAGSLTVRYADGNEVYVAFSGETEHPYPGEVIFADDDGNVHARRWCNRQSARSAVSPATTSALIVAEAMHESAAADVASLIAKVSAEASAVWRASPQTALLHPDRPRFDAAPSHTVSTP